MSTKSKNHPSRKISNFGVDICPICDMEIYDEQGTARDSRNRLCHKDCLENDF